jgi:hypothetical protein
MKGQPAARNRTRYLLRRSSRRSRALIDLSRRWDGVWTASVEVSHGTIGVGLRGSSGSSELPNITLDLIGPDMRASTPSEPVELSVSDPGGLRRLFVVRDVPLATEHRRPIGELGEKPDEGDASGIDVNLAPNPEQGGCRANRLQPGVEMAGLLELGVRPDNLDDALEDESDDKDVLNVLVDPVEPAVPQREKPVLLF